MKITNSEKLMQRAQNIIPGGVNSPVRAFKAMGGNPLFIKKAKGSKIYDADGNCFIDYVGSWGPAILGHAHPKVNAALKKAVDRGTSYGAPTELEIILTELVLEAFPSMDMVRFVNSGTEATMSAIRLARAYAKRDKIIKFDGGYHGHSDGLLVKAGSGAATLGVPDSPGVPADIAKNTYTAIYNDITSVEDILRNDPEGVACIIVEGVPGNMGVVLPQSGFLNAIRDMCRQYGIVLILDEVMSGFRLCYGGAQKVYDVNPDITCLGKVIGGGLPVGAFGGKKKIMEMLAPSGPVYQAGTLSGNPLAMTAGIETLKILKGKGVYEKLENTTKGLCDGLEDIAARRGIPVQIARAGAMFTLFFNDRPVDNYEDAKKSNLERFARYFKKMLESGIYLAPSQFEAVFVSLAHSTADIEKTLSIAKRVFKRL